MRRSSSKLISKAGSMRNINKQGYKFNVILQVESVDKILSASEVVFSWERNAKVITTKPAKVDKDTRQVTFIQEQLQQEVTFFKKKKSESPFEDKVFRCYVKDANNSKKIVGKIDLNFATHIDIPSSSKRMSAQLNNGSKMILKFESKFIGETEKKTKKKDKDTNSLSSYNADDIESEFDPKDQDLGDLNDLEDLEISDDPMIDDSSSTSNNSNNNTFVNQSNDNNNINNNNNTINRPPLGSFPSSDDSSNTQPKFVRKPSNATRNTSNTNNVTRTANYNSAATNDNNARRLGARGPKNLRVNGDVQVSSSINSNAQQQQQSQQQFQSLSSNNNENVPNGGMMNRLRKTASRQDSNDNGAISGGVGTISKTEMEALRKENRSLKRRNEDLQSQVSELEYRLENSKRSSGGGGGGGSRNDYASEIDDLSSENQTLKEHIEELQMQIRREPIYADVVRDLREAKMALAIMNLERDELKQEIRLLKK